MDKEEILNKIKEANIDTAYVLATFLNKIRVGYYENNDLHFYDEVNFNLCTQIRIFNKDIELKIVEIDEKVFSKTIKDEDYTYRLNDEYMFISGNQIIAQNEKFTLIEQINRKIALPLNLTEEEVKKGIRLIVRNYCNIDENNQIIMSESRLVGFSKDEREGKQNV